MARGQNVIPAISKQSVRSSTRRQSKIQAGEDSSEDQMGLDRQKAKPASIKRRLNIRSPTPARGRPLRRPGSPAVNNEESEASEEGGGESGEASDDESESDVKKPSVIAPSGAVRKRRNHQTGLSISFSKSSLSAVDKSKKRARSPTNSGNDNEETRPTKLSKIASNAAALLESSDDDEIYNAVDLISESEDDKDVEKVEEYAIIASEGDFFDLDGAIESSRPSSAISEDAQAQDDETPHFDEHFARTATAHDLDIAVAMDNEQPRKPSWFRQRRVHFADDVFFRETDTSHTVAGDPSGRSELGDAAQKAGIPVGSPAEWAVEAPDDQPGSELEWDETTDEETLPPKTVHRPNERLHEMRDFGKIKANRRRNSLSAYRPSGASSRYEGPSMGSWVADPTKPIAVTDHSGTKLVYIPPSVGTSTHARNDEKGTGFQSPKAKLMACIAALEDDSETEEEDGANSSFQDTVLGPVADQMYSDFHQGARRYESLQTTPKPPMSPSGSVQNVNTKDWEEETEDDDDAGEKNLRIQDLIELSDSSSESESDSDNEVDMLQPDSALDTSSKAPTVRIPSSSPDPSAAESAAWPTLHRAPSRATQGLKRDRYHGSRSSISPSHTKAACKLASKLQGLGSSSKRLKTRH